MESDADAPTPSSPRPARAAATRSTTPRSTAKPAAGSAAKTPVKKATPATKKPAPVRKPAPRTPAAKAPAARTSAARTPVAWPVDAEPVTTDEPVAEPVAAELVTTDEPGPVPTSVAAPSGAESIEGSGPSFRLSYSPIARPSIARPSSRKPAAEPAPAADAEPAAAPEAASVVEAAPVDEVLEVEALEVEALETIDEPEPQSASVSTPAAPAAPAIAAPSPRIPTVRRPKTATPVRPTAASQRPGSKNLSSEVALSVRGLRKTFGSTVAVDAADMEVKVGSFHGFVGPNGAGKTTTLSMVTGLLRPDAGIVKVYGADVWRNSAVAKRMLGVLPDRLRLFDRLTGSEYLHHAGGLRGLDRETTVSRTADLVAAFGLEHSLHRFVSDYSAGMVKKIAIASAMIHSPRLLVLDEPFESVDPVSAQVVIDILQKFTAAGGTVLMSSHSMDLIERVCDSVSIIADGRILASGTLDEVLGGRSLEDRFIELAGGATAVEGMEWLHSYTE